MRISCTTAHSIWIRKVAISEWFVVQFYIWKIEITAEIKNRWLDLATIISIGYCEATKFDLRVQISSLVTLTALWMKPTENINRNCPEEMKGNANVSCNGKRNLALMLASCWWRRINMIDAVNWPDLGDLFCCVTKNREQDRPDVYIWDIATN